MDNFNAFILSLRERLQRPLPGESAQLRMAPVTRARLMKQGADMNIARKAAVLILFYPDNGVRTVLIQRQDYDGIHSNQISFPGGQFEMSDGSLEKTAIRETIEEIGIPEDEIHILGTLSQLYIPPSNFLVLPVLAYLEKPPLFKPDRQEVKKVIPVLIRSLADKHARRMQPVETSYQQRVQVPCYMVDGQIVWGATAMMISELTALIAE